MTEKRPLLVAIDGGATKTQLRIVTVDGTLLGEGTGGPANIASDAEQAAESIRYAFDMARRQAFAASGQTDRRTIRWIACAGLAGAEVAGCADRISKLVDEFDIVDIRTDAFTSCLGAHEGQDGGVIAIGTGSVGYAVLGEKTCRVGGRGFPQSDGGSGAWIGLQAVGHMLKAGDGIVPKTLLSEHISSHLQNSGHDPLTWAIGAPAARFASLAPAVFAMAAEGCGQSEAILNKAGQDIAEMAQALLSGTDAPSFPLVLSGGLARHLFPWLPHDLRKHLDIKNFTSLRGAEIQARNYLKNEICL